ncbi:MAG TPA: Flp pilus assembly protein CpaB [Bryobacteraceae bacterium]|jgi:pilus assembly protein CpaB|nr:Flp pilus assembly protein CpaB [Bryobacteraceae bacterium]
MHRRFISVLLFALIVSGAASFLVYRFILAHVQSGPAKAVSKSRLVVAAHDLQSGALIREADLQSADWSGSIPSQALKDPQEIIGRGVVSTIYEGEPILNGRLAPKGAGAGLATLIPVGKRAVALKVNEVVGLAGFVVPGMRVDVLIAGNPGLQTANQNTWSRTILQNIEVLSAGQKIERRVDGKPEDAEVVNLLVTPEQAEILNLASSEAKVQLVLRNPLDTQEDKTQGVSLASLFGVAATALPTHPAPVAQHAAAAKPQPKPAKEPKLETVEVFSGTKRSEQRLDH